MNGTAATATVERELASQRARPEQSRPEFMFDRGSGTAARTRERGSAGTRRQHGYAVPGRASALGREQGELWRARRLGTQPAQLQQPPRRPLSQLARPADAARSTAIMPDYCREREQQFHPTSRAGGSRRGNSQAARAGSGQTRDVTHEPTAAQAMMTTSETSRKRRDPGYRKLARRWAAADRL